LVEGKAPAKYSLGSRAKELTQMRCRWYNTTSGVKLAYDRGFIEKHWVEDYCFNGGRNCVRKQCFESEGYVSPDYILPDGSIAEEVKAAMEAGEW
jgi:hypothetical protein